MTCVGALIGTLFFYKGDNNSVEVFLGTSRNLRIYFTKDREAIRKKLFNWRVWSWLRLNAGGMLNTCKLNGNGKNNPSGAFLDDE